VFEVTTARGARYVLKDVLQGHEFGLRMERLRSEHRVLAFLHERGLPVPDPLPTDTGETYVIVRNGPNGDASGAPDGRAAMVLTLSALLPDGTAAGPATPAGAEGRRDPWDRPEVWRAVGRAIARLHAALADYPHEIPSYRHDMGERFGGEIPPATWALLAGLRRAAVDAVLGDSADEIRAALTVLPEQYIHGDCHGGNILLAGGTVSGFIDVDHLPFGTRIYDLCYLLADRLRWRIDKADAVARFAQLVPSLIGGYEAGNELSDREGRAIWSGLLATLLSAALRAAQRGNEPLLDRNLRALVWAHEQKHRGAGGAC